MNRLTTRLAVAAIFILILVTGQNAWTQEAKSAPELFMVKFLHAFVAYVYRSTCAVKGSLFLQVKVLPR